MAVKKGDRVIEVTVMTGLTVLAFLCCFSYFMLEYCCYLLHHRMIKIKRHLSSTESACALCKWIPYWIDDI